MSLTVPIESYSPSSSLINITILNGTYIGNVHFMSLTLSLFFCTISIILTTFLVIKHLKHWNDSIAQTHIIRILFMVPIYSINCFLSMLFVEYLIYFDLFRDCYESFVLHQFQNLIIHYFDVKCDQMENNKLQYDEEHIFTTDDGENIYSTKHDDDDDNIALEKRGGEEEEEDRKLSRKEASINLICTTGEYLERHVTIRTHPFPFWCFNIKPGPDFLLKTKRCVTQYIIIKPLATLVAMFLEFFGLYNNGSFSVYYGYIWIALIINFSATVALYWLCIFFEAIYSIIKDYRPISKLITIKLMIFFMFWQSVTISLIYYCHLLPNFSNLSSHQSASILNNFLISIEIVVLAIANLRVFDYDDFKEKNEENDMNSKVIGLKNVIRQGVKAMGKDVFNPIDVATDIQTTFEIRSSSSIKEKNS
jgi:hypothetical protein